MFDFEKWLPTMVLKDTVRDNLKAFVNQVRTLVEKFKSGRSQSWSCRVARKILIYFVALFSSSDVPTCLRDFWSEFVRIL